MTSRSGCVCDCDCKCVGHGSMRMLCANRVTLCVCVCVVRQKMDVFLMTTKFGVGWESFQVCVAAGIGDAQIFVCVFMRVCCTSLLVAHLPCPADAAEHAILRDIRRGVLRCPCAKWHRPHICGFFHARLLATLLCGQQSSHVRLQLDVTGMRACCGNPAAR